MADHSVNGINVDLKNHAKQYWSRQDNGVLKGSYEGKPCGKIINIEAELEEWGRYWLACTVNSLGYGNKSLLVTTLEGSPGTGSKPLPYNEHAERLEAAISAIERLGRKKPMLVVRRHYTRINGDTWHKVAKSLEMAQAAYFASLNAGKKLIKDYIKTH